MLLKMVIRLLQEIHRKNLECLAVTAPSGLAASILQGQTLYSWAGIGVNKGEPLQMIKRIRQNPKSLRRWETTDILIIDEVSMVDGDLFDKLEEVARRLRKSKDGLPFGGIQLIVTGDFYQPPPVRTRNVEARFVFEAQTWRQCIEDTILLTHLFRQRDPIFAGMLEATEL